MMPVNWSSAVNSGVALRSTVQQGGALSLHRLPNGALVLGEPGALVYPEWSDAPILLPAHFEDDPLAMHDHPTAKDRLGDMSAGLGSAATLLRSDAAAIAKLDGVQHVVAGVHENAHIYAEGPDHPQWFTRLHGTEWALRKSAAAGRSCMGVSSTRTMRTRTRR